MKTVNILEEEKMLKLLQCETRQRILEIVANNGRGVSSKEISEELRISQSIALRHLRDFQQAGVLRSEKYTPQYGGRPGELFFLMPDKCQGVELCKLGKLRIFIELEGD